MTFDTETRKKVKIRLWMVAVKEKLRETTNQKHRQVLVQIHKELEKRFEA